MHALCTYVRTHSSFGTISLSLSLSRGGRKEAQREWNRARVGRSRKIQLERRAWSSVNEPKPAAKSVSGHGIA